MFEHLTERSAILSEVNRLRTRTDDRYSGVLKPLRQSKWGLTTELHNDTGNRTGR